MPKDKTLYLPGLNGIRAIAALAVVFSHIILNLESFGLYAHFLGTKDNGGPQGLHLAGFGVTMFFTLSGFLITYLLLIESKKNPINIKKFYFRRILRIWPLYYLYFLICLISYFLVEIDFNQSSIVYYLFFSANIPFMLGLSLPYLAHFWSLGVEEQFYIFWPWINKLKLKKLFLVSITLFSILFGTKVLLHFIFPNTILEAFLSISRFDCMILGGLGAILYYSNYPIFLKVTTSFYTQLLSWAVIFTLAFNKFHIASILDHEILSVITLILIMGQIKSKGLINLETRFFDFIGKISYGIYVIHPLLIVFFKKYLKDLTSYNSLNYFLVFSIITGSTIFLSYISYTYFESYFIRLKNKNYGVVKSSGSMLK